MTIFAPYKGGSGPLSKKWLLFNDSNCFTSAQGARFSQLCPTEETRNKVWCSLFQWWEFFLSYLSLGRYI